MNHNVLTLIRGIPGSGKTTLAESLLRDLRDMRPRTFHIEADMYHITPLGDYAWAAENVKKAHEWCLENTKILLNSGRSVIVSNTFTRLWEMKPYLDHAQALGLRIFVYRMENRFKNIHNVPESTIEAMEKRFENYPGEVIMKENEYAV